MRATRAGLAGGAFAVCAAFATSGMSACGSFDDTDAPPADASTADAKDASREAEAAATPTLANHVGVVTLVQDAVTDQISTNGVLYSYFAPNTTGGHQPSLDDIEECLAYQLGSIMGNGDVYPPTAPLADGYVCRASMMAIHQPLDIPAPVFEEFVSALVVESAVLNIVLPVDTENQLLGLGAQIIDPDAPDASLPYGWENAGDGGADAGDSGTTIDAGHDAGADAGPDAGAGSGSDAGDAGDASDSGADAAG
jgi:hypothetical protein